MTLLPLHASDCLEKSVKKICYGSEIETLNLSICKKKLEVKRHTSSIKALTELARTPFKYWWNKNCVKSVRTRSYSGLHFPAFGLNAERYSVSLRIQFECGKMQTRITPNTDFLRSEKYSKYFQGKIITRRKHLRKISKTNHTSVVSGPHTLKKILEDYGLSSLMIKLFRYCWKKS